MRSDKVPTVDRGHAFPLFAAVLGGMGSLCLGFGLLGHYQPDALAFAPLLGESLVSSALIVVGTVLIAIELALILPWLRRRSAASGRQ